MNSFTQALRSITIGEGRSFAKTESWQDQRSKLVVPNEIVSLATSQCYNLTLILRDQYLLRIMISLGSQENPQKQFSAFESLFAGLSVKIKRGRVNAVAQSSLGRSVWENMPQV